MAICHNLQVADLGFCDRKIPISGVWHQPPSRSLRYMSPILPYSEGVAGVEQHPQSDPESGIEVTPHRWGWALRRHGSPQEFVCATHLEAVARAKEILSRSGGGTAIVHGRAAHEPLEHLRVSADAFCPPVLGVATVWPDLREDPRWSGRGA